MNQSTTIIAALESGALDGLVHLAVSFVMQRPVSALLDPEWIADQVVGTLQATTEGERTEDWIRQRIRALREKVPEGRLGDRAPAEVIDPLRQVLARPFRPDRELVRRLMDHAAVEQVFKDTLTATLQGFAGRVGQLTAAVPPPAPLSRGIGRLRSLQRKAQQGVLGELSRGIERQAELRIREHVEDAIKATLDQVADHLCAVENLQLHGDFRVHLLQTLLDTDSAVLASELDKLDPDSLVSTGAAVTAALVRRPQIRDEIASLVRASVEGAGERSLQDFLDESGLDQGWRTEVEQQLTIQARGLLKTAEFADWLEALLRG